MTLDYRNWVILIAGGHAAGKKLVCQDLQASLERLATKDAPIEVEVLHMADFEKPHVDAAIRYTPERIDFNKLRQTLLVKDSLHPTKHTVIILEGLYALFDKEITDCAVMKVFVDSDADTRLSRWILKDIGHDQSKLGSILEEYLNHARPEMNQFIAPTKQFADVILPRGSEESGIQLVSTGVYDRIREEQIDGSTVSGAVTPTVGKSMVNLRRESFMEQSQRFYDLS